MRIRQLAPVAGLALLVAVPSWGAETVVEAWRSDAEAFSYPYSVSVNPTDGSCWVADYNANQVVHVSAAGADLWRSDSGAFLCPQSVSADPADASCWVADSGNNQVVRLSAAGAELWRSAGGAFALPFSVSVDPTDHSCWVADTEHSQVVHLSAAGAELWRSANGAFSWVQSVSVNSADGSCWVADFDRGLVHLSAAGAELWSSAGGAFSYPWSVSANPADGSCWVADYGHNQVAHLSAAGAELWRSASNAFSLPFSVSVNPADGSCWVADFYHGQVVHLSAAGTELWRADSGQFYPYAVSVNPADGSCWVADTSNGQVVILAITSPSTDFSGTPTRGVAPLEVTFTNLTTTTPSAPVTSWAWDFGDGCTSTEENPSHVYTSRGGYTVGLTATSTAGEGVETKQGYILVTFPDTPSWAAREIVACIEAGIVGGYPDGKYHPEIVVTRDQMAAFIARALAGGDTGVPSGPPVAHFPDVDTQHWGYKYVEYAYANNIVSGYPGGNYEPTWEVDRGQMAAFIARSIVSPTGEAGLAGYTPPATPSFPDVLADFWTFKHIEYLKAQGIVGGYPGGWYHPEVTCTRDQMAVFIARAFELTL